MRKFVYSTRVPAVPADERWKQLGTRAPTWGGAGFSGLTTNWDAQAMKNGAIIGAASGLVGAGFASGIGGGGGAFVGGMASDATSQLLSTGDLNIGRSIVAGAASFGMYHGVTALNYAMSPVKNQLSYRRFSAMQADLQRDQFWGREQKSLHLKGGGVRRIESKWRNAFKAGGDGAFAGVADSEVEGQHHTHGDPDKDYYELRRIDRHGQLRGRRVPSFLKGLRSVVPAPHPQIHNSNIYAGELSVPWSQYVVTPKQLNYHNYSTNAQAAFFNPFSNYFPLFTFW